MSLRKRQKIQALLWEERIMTLHRLSLLYIAAICFCFSLFSPLPSFAEEWSAPVEILRLYREAPPLEAYEGASAMVWLRENRYRLLSSGDMEQVTRWLIFANGPLKENWRTWKIPVPHKGELTLQETALYDPVSGRLISPLVPSSEKDGVPFVTVRVPPLDGNYVLAIAYRRTFPKRYNVDDVLWTVLDLPQWEQRVNVEVPSGMQLFWSSSAGEPKLERDGVADHYVWQILNQPPWVGKGILAQREGVLAFSLREGAINALQPMMDWVNSMGSITPQFVKDALKDANKAKAGQRIIDWALDPKKKLGGVPWDWARPASELPTEGPWSEWERVGLLHHWLKSADWKSEVLWLPAFPLADKVPGTGRIWLRPVLRLSAPGVSRYYLDGKHPIINGVPSSLSGRTLYALDGANVVKDVIPQGSYSDHRFTIRWNVTVDENGSGSGEVSLHLRGGWIELMPEGESSDVRELLDSFVWPSGLQIDVANAAVEVLKDAYRITVPFSGMVAIPAGGQMLLRLPSAVPKDLLSLGNFAPPYHFLFPFIVEQEGRFTLPKGYDVVSSPPVRGGGKDVIFKEELKWNAKRRFLNSSYMLILKSSTVDINTSAELSNALKEMVRWNELTVPFRKR
jgi:hypothetical protein